MRTACFAMMLSAVFITGCGESKLDEIERRTLKLLDENPTLENDEIKSLDVEYKGEDARGDKYSGLLEIERDGKTVMFALDITVNDVIYDDVTVNGEKGEPIETKELFVTMKEVDE